MFRSITSCIKGAFKDPYFIIALFLTLISLAYWTLFSINAYNTFHEYADVGTFAYDMYYHIHYPNVVGGLQYLVFATHIAPDMLLILPIFAIFQSTLTLLLIQAIALSATALVIFIVSRELLRDSRYAFLLCFAYLLNPGMHGMLIFDFHAESFITLFYILTFYYYIKEDRNMTLVSLILLLGSMDVAPFLGLTLGLGLITYEFLHTKNKKQKDAHMRLGAMIVAMSVLAFLFYSFVTSYLTNTYATSYSVLPKQFKILTVNSREIGYLSGLLNGTKNPPSLFYYQTGVFYLFTAVVIVFMGFGVACLADPVLSVILASPWLVELFIIGRPEFALTWYQYFGFVLGGIIAATILTTKRLLATHPKKKEFIKSLLNTSMIVVIVFLTIMSPFLLLSKNTNDFSQDLLFRVNASQSRLYSSLKYVMNSIPSNAQLMAPFFTMPQLFSRKYFEVIPSNTGNETPWFAPQYILTDFNSNVSLNAFSGNQLQGFLSVLRNASYQLYASNGTAMLYKAS